MILRAYLFLVFIVFSSSISFSQLIIKDAEFTPKNILSKIFQGEFQDDKNLQKWPVSSVQALEMDNYIDANNFSYTSVDTILNLNLDTTNYKIVVFTNFQVDSSGWIQDYMFSQIQIGMAYFEKRESDFYLIKLNSNVSTTTQGSRPKSRIEEIGTSKFALVLKEEIVQDCGREYWFEILKEGFPLFLTYDYMAYIPSENSYILENSIEIVKTENEYFDFFLNTTRTVVTDFEQNIANNRKTKRISLSFKPSGVYNHLNIPSGYIIQEK